MSVNPDDYPVEPDDDQACGRPFWSSDEDPAVDGPWVCTLVDDHEGPHAAHCFSERFADGFDLAAVEGHVYPLRSGDG